METFFDMYVSRNAAGQQYAEQLTLQLGRQVLLEALVLQTNPRLYSICAVCYV